MKRHLNKVALASAILAFSAAALPAAEPLFSYGFSEDKATGQTEFDKTFAVFDANSDGDIRLELAPGNYSVEIQLLYHRFDALLLRTML